MSRRSTVQWDRLLGLTRHRWAASALFVLAAVALLATPSPAQGVEGDHSATSEIRTTVAETFFVLRHPVTKEIEWLGSAIIWFLMALSITSLALIGAMMLGAKRSAYAPGEVVDRCRKAARDRRVNDLLNSTKSDESVFGHVLRAALAEVPHGAAAVVRSAEQESESQLVRRMRSLEPLNIIGNVSPMIGLFGTVYGMILAFREIVASGGTPDPVELAAGIGTALVTTFWGLIVAIPALAGYALLRSRVDALVVEASRGVEAVINELRAPVEQVASAAGTGPRPGDRKGVA